MFCSHPDLFDSDQIFDDFLEAGVVLSQAQAMVRLTNHLRLSVGVESLERIFKAIDTIQSIIEKEIRNLFIDIGKMKILILEQVISCKN